MKTSKRDEYRYLLTEQWHVDGRAYACPHRPIVNLLTARSELRDLEARYGRDGWASERREVLLEIVVEGRDRTSDGFTPWTFQSVLEGSHLELRLEVAA